GFGLDKLHPLQNNRLKQRRLLGHALRGNVMNNKLGLTITLLCLILALLTAGRTAVCEQPAKDKADVRFQVLVDDVGKYLEQADVPKRKGMLIFRARGVQKGQDVVVEATYLTWVNHFKLGYVLKAKLTGSLQIDLG